MVYRGFKTQIFPTEEQKKYIDEMINIRRWLWNKTHELYKDADISIKTSEYKMAALVKKIEIPFNHTHIHERLKSGVGRRYAQAWKFFFKKVKKQPHFHSWKYKKSVEFIDVNLTKLKLCGYGRKKDYTLAKAEELPIYEKICSVSFCIHADKYYVSCILKVNDDNIKKEKSLQGNIGLDFGIKNFFTDDKGNFYNIPQRVIRISQRINKLQHILSKKQKGSNNFEKVRKKIVVAYQRRTNIIYDYIEKLTLKFLRENTLIGLETLNMLDMSKELYRKTRNVAYLNCFGRFRDRLVQKKERFGECTIIFVDKFFPSSQICSVCGHRHKVSINDRIYKCKCGNELNRDINAARNILAESRRLLVNS